jgi:hypothetical protein
MFLTERVERSVGQEAAIPTFFNLHDTLSQGG